MSLWDFHTNDESMASEIPEGDRGTKKEVSLLGMNWNTPSDSLTLQMKTFPGGDIKRETLSFIAGHYDLLGLTSPALLPWEKFCQGLWTRKIDWDEELDEE